MIRRIGIMGNLSVLAKIDLYLLPMLLVASFLAALDKVRVPAHGATALNLRGNIANRADNYGLELAGICCSTGHER